MAATLGVVHGISVRPAGRRDQSYDLEVPLANGAFARVPGINPGKYEVKALWRRRPNDAFDPRFKVGRRGERIYGVRDSLIKSFAVALEDHLDYMLEHSVAYPGASTSRNELAVLTEETHAFIDQAMQRRHSKRFAARLERLAHVSQRIPTMTAISRRVLYDCIQPAQIVGGFADLEGIFIVAGPRYTLVTRDEIPEFLAFDSVSSEGLKLRYTKSVPRGPSVQEEEKREAGEGKDGV